MVNYIKHISLPVFLLLLFTACKKSELTSYTQPGMVYFYKDHYDPDKDSIVYSFAIKSNALQADTIKIPLRIMGAAADYDRSVNIQVVTDSSTATPDHYTILPTVIKAGEYTTNVSLLVYRKPDLKSNELRLLLEVAASDDFQPGIYNSASGASMGGGSVRFPVRINDYLTKPLNWDTFMVFYFGSYSQVKYKIVIDVTGRTEFSTGATGLTPSEMTYFGKACSYYLEEYNRTNGTKLTDETGQEVTFPLL
ncbi:DUF4843 domain-containing protein [Longitalea luteola]|uniref:DUF4843 domain-containing protein n=1 Tax=Longitalea luteola TaxID=2812563 RepID=UPI001A97A687|nr:DUF4843 domain-containing protein [Longitalea luteola]